MGETIRIAARDGTEDFGGYLAAPDGARAGIVVVQEIFGVNAGLRAMADGWASHGFTALVPDLFWRLEPGVELDADVPAELERAYALMGRFDLVTGIADIAAAIHALRARGCGHVGVVGYCLGGLLAYLAATRTDSDASVGYYGVNLDKFLGEQHAIGKPLMLHVGARDHLVSDAARDAVAAGLAGNRHVTLHSYDADHAFARHAGSTRVDALAEQADARTLAFFGEHLA